MDKNEKSVMEQKEQENQAAQEIQSIQGTQSTPVIAAKKSRKAPVIIAGVSVAAVLLIGFFLYMFAFGGYDRIRVSMLCDLGDRYLDEMDYEQAVASYQAAIEIDPKAEDAYMGLAEAYIGLGIMNQQ